MCSSIDAVDELLPSDGSGSQPPASAPKQAGRKRRHAELPAEDAEADPAVAAAEAAEAAATAEPAAVPERRSSRRAAAGVQAAVAAEMHNTALDEPSEAAARPLPQRAAAVRSPAGKRRRLTGILQLAEAAAAEAAAESAALAEAWDALDAAEAAAVEAGVTLARAGAGEDEGEGEGKAGGACSL